jgi:competence protein ComGC
MRKVKAFSLFELLVVLFIIACIAIPIAIGVGVFVKRNDIAKGVGEIGGKVVQGYKTATNR